MSSGLRGLRDYVESSRTRVQSSSNRSVRLALTTWERDLVSGGALMAAALAFRLFLWTLPAALVAVSVLGFGADSDDQPPATGLRGYTLSTVEEAAQQSHAARYVTLIVGTVLLLMVTRQLAKTVVVATALTWGEPLRKVPRPFAALGVTLAFMLVAVALSAAAGWLRSESATWGVVATVLVAIGWGALWWRISTYLPHGPDLPWWGLLPGAALFGVGTQVLHLATVYYFAGKITSASALYGSLGIAATLLLWVYVVARLVLAAAAVNVAAQAPTSSPPSGP